MRALHAYDKKGAQLFKWPGYISSFSDGMAATQGETEKGYIDSTGKMALALPYDNLGNFTDGIAKVAPNYSDPSFYINKNGKDVTDTVSSGIRVILDDSTRLFGFEDKNGNPITDKKFSEAEPFLDGLAIVNASGDSSQPLYGIIDGNGNYALEPKYTGIRRMRNGSFAVGPGVTEGSYVSYSFFEVTTKALFSKDLANHTDWIFTSLDNLDKTFVCVTDGKRSYYLDADLNQAKDLPEFNGNGLMLADGDKLRGTLNGALTVADHSGNILMQDHSMRMLQNGIYTTTVTEYPDTYTTINYPVLNGMKDLNIQSKMNQIIRGTAISVWQPVEDNGDPYSFPVLYVTSSIRINKDLLQIDQGIDQYWMGAAHGGYYRDNRFINIQNGNTYTLADLFKSPDEAVQKLSEIITERMLEKPDDYYVDGVTPDQVKFFYLNGNGITVYFGEYEIAPYAAGLQEFDIPFSDISDLINYEGEFWKSFN